MEIRILSGAAARTGGLKENKGISIHKKKVCKNVLTKCQYKRSNSEKANHIRGIE